MRLYFSYRNIPELAGLNPQQRKAVYQCGMEALFAEHRDTLRVCTYYFFGGLLGGALLAWMAAQGSGSTAVKWLSTIGGGFVGVIVGCLLGNHFLHTRLRPYLRRALEERKDEIAKIN